ncbi:MAG: RluA family pseudouridine synthase [Thermodesulfovibrionales bacterium]
MNRNIHRPLTVSPDDNGKRIDQFISEATGITRSQVQKMIEIGNITIAGFPVKKKHKVKQGEIITIKPLPEHSEVLIPQKISLEVIHEDNHLIVIDKSPGLVMYPALGHSRNTLMNALANRCDKLATIGGPLRPGVVHRLDKDTSGLVVVALTDEAYYSLQKEFKERTIEREYLAIVHGTFKKSPGEIDAPIGRAVSDRKRMSTKTRHGKEAITFYKVISSFTNSSLIQARLATGRTHQIRVHFASQGHPVLGDKTYGRKTHIKIGNRTIIVTRQMLHAHTLGFTHPATARKMSFSSPMPEDMRRILDILKDNDQTSVFADDQ